jgi:methyl-accepting chemotaxis protein
MSDKIKTDLALTDLMKTIESLSKQVTDLANALKQLSIEVHHNRDFIGNQAEISRTTVQAIQKLDNDLTTIESSMNTVPLDKINLKY